MDISLEMNADFLDSQYQRWKSDPGSVSEDWRIFFLGFEFGLSGECGAVGICEETQVLRQSRVELLIHRYRDIGHLLSCLDPLMACPTDHPLLDLNAFDLTGDDLNRTFYVPRTLHTEPMSLQEIVRALKETYCHTIGIEYMHLQDPEERLWLQERMEPIRNRPALGKDSQLHLLNKLTQATLFDQFLHSRYMGQKRFSAEGAEVVVAMLDVLADHEAEHGCREIILGMAHRGRLNVQTNVLSKPYEAVFCEFEGSYDPDSLVGSGDVKYHMGYLADIKTRHDHHLQTLLVPNASHLESVDSVVEGIARARQESFDPGGRQAVLPILIHGDAAFAGEGVVAETLNLSQLEGYSTGGTVHIIVNNQIGFTTLPQDARSTRYSTDVAKMLMVPIFHIHGEDPEAVVHVVRLAADYRRHFSKDVVIDVVCYRRYGHSEGDEPYYTQPQMYDRIKNRPPPSQIYAEKLISEGTVSKEELSQIQEGITQCLEAAHRSAQGKACTPPHMGFFENWEGLTGIYTHDPLPTGVPRERLVSVAEKAHVYPEGFTPYRRLDHILQRRLEAIRKGKGIDWAGAELLAFASLLVEGTPVRLSGEDSRRGTFSQRHSVLVDPRTGQHHTPLSSLGEDQAPFMVYDSMLSENAVLGFEYGYAMASPHALVIWEAQFGDFANNAQVIIDQYIAAGESKWGRLCGLVMLLPHGFEGQGPEHSSARIERYLQLCAEDNMQVCNPTTPAQYFHLLRRQARRSFRKPLIVMAPKSILRHPMAVSTLDEMASGYFHEVLDDTSLGDSPAKRVLICSGKIYYDLLQRREQLRRDDTAILRLDQLYPFPVQQLRQIAGRWLNAAECFWVQEEPENMGAWGFVRWNLQEEIGREIRYLGRKAAASPATGYAAIHKAEQAALIEEALGSI
jgi:2-oxoglutarate dehydrogenase E1 component